MPGATYTETTVADNVTVTCARFRVNPSTLDWKVTLQCQIVAANGDVIKIIDVDMATLISGGALTTFKGNLTAGLAALATNRGISPNL